METTEPVFRDLSQTEVLKKCLRGRTQNLNENVNNVICTRIPNNVLVEINTMYFGVYGAIGSYNRGNIIMCKVLQTLGLTTRKCMIIATLSIDLSLIHI